MDKYAQIERWQKIGFSGVILAAFSLIVADAFSNAVGGVMFAVGMFAVLYSVQRLSR